MAVLNFLGSKLKSLKADGSVNASGTVEFFAVGGAFSTYVSSYTSSALTTPNSNVVTLDAAGEADVWLNSDADVRIKDSTGTTLDTQLNINPVSAAVAGNFNLVENGSFETDANSDDAPDEWDVTTFTGGTAAIDTTDRSHGATSMKFVSAGNGGGTITTSSFFNVTASGLLYWSFDLKSTADVRNLAQVLWYDADQIAIGSPTTDLYDNSATNPTSWTRKQGRVSIPATAYFGKFKFFGGHSSDATAGTIRIDNVVLAEATENLEGPDIASASTTSVFDGFFSKHITGTTGITSFGTANYAGERVRVVFDDALTLTHAANLNLPGAINILTVAGDWAYLYADTTTQIDVEYYRASGAPLANGTNDVQQFDVTGTWTKPTVGAYTSNSLVRVQEWAAGGSGGRGEGSVAGGGGGGGGAYAEFWTTLGTLGVTEAVTVGVGGASETNTNTNGNGGTDTVFAGRTAYGGGGGAADSGAGGGGGGGGSLGAGGSASTTSGGVGGRPRLGVQATTNVVGADNEGFGGGGGGGGGTAGAAGGRGVYGGGGGGGGETGAGTGSTQSGGPSVFGGGGGGGSAISGTGGSGGTSIHGGAGGASGVDSTPGVAGTAPAGGGGGSENAASGAGAAGRVIVTVYA